MSRKILAKNAMSAVLQVLTTGVLTFELYRFLNRHLTVAQIGIWSVVLAGATTGRLIDLGLGGGVVKFVAKYMGENSRAEAGTTIQMALAGMAVLFCVASLSLFPLLYSGLAFLIKDPSSLEQARALLPYALATLIIGALSGVTLSALDGCQRMDLRAILGVTGSLVQLVSAYCLVPRLALLGLALGQVIQSVVVFVSGMLLLLRLVGPDLCDFRGWKKSKFGELIRYGSGFQAAAVGQILFEPAVKAILTRYSGLEFTGYYEMANRMVLQLRSLLVSAYQSLVPYVAGALKSEEELRGIYISSYRLLFLLTALGFGFAGLWLPFALQMWLGRFVPKFIEIGDLCLLGWALNTLCAPAYFILIGAGKLGWPVLSHTAIGMFSVAFGILFGSLFGGFGVLGAAMMALTFGSHLVPFAFHVRHKISWRWLIPRESWPTCSCAVLGSLCVLVSTLAVGTSTQPRVIVLAVFLSVALIYSSRGNPNAGVMLRLFGEMRRRRHENSEHSQ
jgi:O-antigen/teichoic acid export membrane protein